MAHLNTAIDDIEAAYETDAFTCSICYSRLSNIKMCPFCSKMYHENCLHEWLKVKENCPNCQHTLTSKNVVVCRWAQEVLQHFGELEAKSKSLLEERNRILEKLKTGKEKYAFKLIIIGNSGIGKTALMRRFAEDKFDFSFPATVAFECVHRKVLVGGEIIRLVMFDTAGQEQFDAVTTGFYRDADAIIVAFDVTDKDSFYKVTNWHNKAVLNSEKAPVMLLVATKTDIADKRVVTPEQGQNLADALGIRFLETSSLKKVNVEETFYSIAAVLKDQSDREMEEDFQQKQRGCSTRNAAKQHREGSIKLGQIERPAPSSSAKEKRCPSCVVM